MNNILFDFLTSPCDKIMDKNLFTRLCFLLNENETKFDSQRI